MPPSSASDTLPIRLIRKFADWRARGRARRRGRIGEANLRYLSRHVRNDIGLDL